MHGWLNACAKDILPYQAERQRNPHQWDWISFSISLNIATRDDVLSWSEWEI